MTCYQEITCPDCGGSDIMKSGRSASGTQRYRCRNPDGNLAVRLELACNEAEMDEQWSFVGNKANQRC